MNEPAIIDLRVPQGDTLAQTFRLMEAGTPLDLAETTVAAELRHPRTLEVIPLAVTVGPEAGEFTIFWDDPAPHGHYQWDVELTAAGQVRTWITGRFHVVRDVTNELAA